MNRHPLADARTRRWAPVRPIRLWLLAALTAPVEVVSCVRGVEAAAPWARAVKAPSTPWCSSALLVARPPVVLPALAELQFLTEIIITKQKKN